MSTKTYHLCGVPSISAWKLVYLSCICANAFNTSVDREGCAVPTPRYCMSTHGIIFGSLASLCFGAGIVVNKVGLAQSALHPLEYTALTVIVAGVLGGVVIVPQRAALYSCSWLCILNILFLGITASVISYVFLFWGQSLTKAINTGFLISLSGFFTVIYVERM